MRRLPSTLSRTLPWFLLALSLTPLLVWMLLGAYSRYMADDYSTSYALFKGGFWQAQLDWYRAWSGRYSFTFLVFLVELFGVRAASWLPWLGLSAWFLSLFWALKQILKLLEMPLENKWLGFLAGVIVFGSARSLGDYSQVIFWQTGILTYEITNVFLAAGLALFVWRFLLPASRSGAAAWEYVLSFVLAFLVGGFSETGVVVQVALLTLAVLYFSFLYRGANRAPARLVLLAAWLGSLLALVVIVKAPGNLHRNAGLAGLSIETLGAAFVASFGDALLFLFEWARDNRLLAGMLLLAGASAGFIAAGPAPEKKNGHLQLGLALALLAYLMLAAGFFPSFVAWGTRPPERAVFVPLFILVWVVCLLGVLAGRAGASFAPVAWRMPVQALGFALLVVALFWMQVRTAVASQQLLPALQSYARLWDARDAMLRQAGAARKGALVIPSLRRDPALHDLPAGSIWLLGELEEDPHFWINQAAASYYGLKSITGK